ncbi:MAG: hypothetical protein LBF38_10595 [Deltaproteobacteria bacterium]|jgi:hypothetical protein|nr:hypothetical protein [Deltaproteobacteria bacterium]
MNGDGAKAFVDPPKKNKIILFAMYFGLLGAVVAGVIIFAFFSGSFSDNPAVGTWKIDSSGFGYLYPIFADENVTVKITDKKVIFSQGKTRQELEVEFEEVNGKWIMRHGEDVIGLEFTKNGKLVLGDERYFNLVLEKGEE